MKEINSELDLDPNTTIETLLNNLKSDDAAVIFKIARSDIRSRCAAILIRYR